MWKQRPVGEQLAMCDLQVPTMLAPRVHVMRLSLLSPVYLESHAPLPTDNSKSLHFSFDTGAHTLACHGYPSGTAAPRDFQTYLHT